MDLRTNPGTVFMCMYYGSVTEEEASCPLKSLYVILSCMEHKEIHSSILLRVHIGPPHACDNIANSHLKGALSLFLHLLGAKTQSKLMNNVT